MTALASLSILRRYSPTVAVVVTVIYLLSKSYLLLDKCVRFVIITGLIVVFVILSDSF